MQLGSFSGPTETDSALAHIESMVRKRFSLGHEIIVLIGEERPTEPGFPESMTRVRFWKSPIEHYSYGIFKPAAGVSETDLPPVWWMEAMRDHGEGLCSCC
jgi:hypothetical protein